MTKSAKYLKELADHFAPRDWNYTRHHHIESIRYETEYDKHNKISRRVKWASRWLFGKTPDWIKQLEGRSMGPVSRIRIAAHSLKRDPNTPDGILDGGKIITLWEEDGEYLNMMQPTVGSLVADFLIAEPEHPHAVIITKELDRLRKNYDKRIKAGEVS